jgi:hypothetical protein
VKPLLYLLPAQCWEEQSYIYDGYSIWAARDENDWAVGVFQGTEMIWRSLGNAYLNRQSAIAGGIEWLNAH